VESYIKEEPVKEPGIEPCAANASHSADFIFDQFCDLFIEAFPRLGNRSATIAELGKAIEAGEDPERIIAAAKAYADEQKGNQTQFVSMSENWLRAQRWANYQKPQSDAEKADLVLAGRAKAIKARQSWVVGLVSSHQAAEMVRRGLVTPEDCKAAGVDL
jgi:hypothetical protein